MVWRTSHLLKQHLQNIVPVETVGDDVGISEGDGVGVSEGDGVGVSGSVSEGEGVGVTEGDGVDVTLKLPV